MYVVKRDGRTVDYDRNKILLAIRKANHVVGKEEAARIFQANNNKKIGSFWKTNPEDKNDDD